MRLFCFRMLEGELRFIEGGSIICRQVSRSGRRNCQDEAAALKNLPSLAGIHW
jgi:hypothetical protein